MSVYDAKASALQDYVRATDVLQDVSYEDKDVRMAIIHAREDIVALVSHTSEANKQLRTIRILLWGISLILAVLLFSVILK